MAAGRRVAGRPHDRFDVLGDLYTLPIDGGTATRIIGGLSFESQPRFSPDGKTMAFLSDRTGVENLWIADADGGNPRAVSKDRQTRDRPQIMVSPSWTPDGQYIVVSKSRPPDPGTFWLFLYHRDGGNGVRIGRGSAAAARARRQGPPPAPPANRMGAVVSPDGRYIYYAQRTGTLHLQRAVPAVADLSARSRDRRGRAGDQRAGQRHAPGALARRHVAGLRHALQDATRACACGTSRPAPSDGWCCR